MLSRIQIIGFLLIFLSSSLYAEEMSTTLHTPDGGKVNIRYDVNVNEEGVATVKILNLQKKLGVGNNENLERIKVLFFDKSGGYSEDQFISDIATEALMIPSDEINYSRSTDGIVWLDNHPEIKLKLLKKKSTLSIPVYLVRYLKKHKYRILGNCGNWQIDLEVPSQTGGKSSGTNDRSKRTLTTIEEVEDTSELSDTETAVILINRIEELLENSPSDRLPEGLDFYAGQLRELEFRIRDDRFKARISKILKDVERKKEDVKKYSDELHNRENSELALMEEEKNVRSNIEYLNERLENISTLSENDVAEMKIIANEIRRQSHSVSDPELSVEMTNVADRCDEEIRKIDESKKRRNIWMIIGGIFLGFLMLIGNQVFQHFRNLRNQKNILEMQEKLAKQAQNEAARRVRGLAYNKMAQTRNSVRGKVTKKVEKGVSNLSKGKGKKVSI